jgi:hypothetical protein
LPILSSQPMPVGVGVDRFARDCDS